MAAASYSLSIESIECYFIVSLLLSSIFLLHPLTGWECYEMVFLVTVCYVLIVIVDPPCKPMKTSSYIIIDFRSHFGSNQASGWVFG